MSRQPEGGKLPRDGSAPETKTLQRLRKANEMASKDRRWWRLYLLLGIFAAGGYFLLPSVAARNVLSLLIGVSAIAAIAVGVYLHRPSRPLPWYLFALSLLMFVAGDVISTFYENVRGMESPLLAHVLYIAGFPFMAGALLVIQEQRFGRDLAGVIDPVIIATGAGMLSWVFLMNPYADAQSLSLLERLVSISYPLMDVLLLAVVARLLFMPGDRPPAYYLLSAGLVSTLIFDTIFAWRRLMDGTGEPTHAGWLLFFVFFFGAAALHPSMDALPKRPALDVRTRLTWRRLALLAGATLMAPGALAIQEARGEDIDVAVIVGGSVVLFLLVLARVASLMRARERTGRRPSEKPAPRS